MNPGERRVERASIATSIGTARRAQVVRSNNAANRPPTTTLLLGRLFRSRTAGTRLSRVDVARYA
jgi:hypothetical protein